MDKELQYSDSSKLNGRICSTSSRTEHVRKEKQESLALTWIVSLCWIFQNNVNITKQFLQTKWVMISCRRTSHFHSTVSENIFRTTTKHSIRWWRSMKWSVEFKKNPSNQIYLFTWAPQCWMTRCNSSWTNSTQRWHGSCKRLICRLTSNSKVISGTNRAGRGPWASSTKNIWIFKKFSFLPSHFWSLLKYRPLSNRLTVWSSRVRVKMFHEKCNKFSLRHIWTKQISFPLKKSKKKISNNSETSIFFAFPSIVAQ